MPSKKKGASNEEIFLKEATTNLAFRTALAQKDREKISKDLDRIGVKVQDKEKILDAIMDVNWSHLKVLEDRLIDGLHQTMN